MNIYGPRQLVRDVQNSDLCIGCGACVDLCPYFRNFEGKTVQLFDCDLEQGRCHAYCPKAEVDLDELSQFFWNEKYQADEIGKYRRVVAARAGEKTPRGHFQGGGTVTAIISFALKNGLLDAAVLTDSKDNVPVPRLVTQWEDTARCASTKMSAAPTLAALNEGVQKGFLKIGVVGTPCQITSVALMKQNPMNREDFSDPVGLTIGLFCNWSLDTRGLNTFLSRDIDLTTITGMEIPPPPEQKLVLQLDEGTEEFPLQEVRQFIPETCFICPDMTAEWADIAVGMYEGRAGWNTLIIRTQKGEEIVDRAVSEKWLETEDFPQRSVDHLKQASANKRKRMIETAKRRALINTDGTGSAIRMNPDAVKKILSQEYGD